MEYNHKIKKNIDIHILAENKEDILDEKIIKRNLDTNFMGKNICVFHEIDSTSTYCKNNSYELVEGSLIICEIQTSGRGRFSKVWDHPNGNIAMSIILKPKIDISKISKITQVCASAIYEALKEVGIKTKIKWPNDLVIENKKICGILTELKIEKENDISVVVGIGLNANSDMLDFSDDINQTITSIYMETEKKINRNVLIAIILNKFEIFYNEFINDNFNISLDICRKNSNLIGRYVYLINDGDNLRAKAIDIGLEGELILMNEDGKEFSIKSGEVSVRINDNI